MRSSPAWGTEGRLPDGCPCDEWRWCPTLALAITVAVLFNLGMLFALFLLQRREMGTGVKHGRRVEDYITGSVGNPLGVATMNAGVAMALYHVPAFHLWMLGCCAFAAVVAAGFDRASRVGVYGRHWSGSTLSGRLHLVHIFIGVAVATTGVGLLSESLAGGATGGSLIVAYSVAIAGGGLYFLTVILDLATGRIPILAPFKPPIAEPGTRHS